jgi:hypothetical protein
MVDAFATNTFQTRITEPRLQQNIRKLLFITQINLRACIRPDSQHNRFHRIFSSMEIDLTNMESSFDEDDHNFTYLRKLNNYVAYNLREGRTMKSLSTQQIEFLQRLQSDLEAI